MSANRPHLITRKSDGAFWCGMIDRWQPLASDAEIYDSIMSAYRAAAFVTDDPATVEPADWYLPVIERIEP